MIIRLLGAMCLVLGALVVTHDLATIFVYGEPDASLLAELLAFTRWSGRGEWGAYVMWIMPMWVGAWLLIASARSRSRRPLRQPGT